MQTFTYKFDPTQNQTAMAWMVDANLFVYESGVAAVDGQNRAVIVKPDNGSEITLKPGQRFRLAPGADARTWAVRLVDPTVTLTANFIIGQGEFEDSNTLNTFKLDGTFTNTVAVNNTAANAVPTVTQAGSQVQINNTAASRVPVALDTTATQQVSIVGTVNVAGSTVNYTNAWADSSTPQNATQVVLTVLTPAQNPNGLYIELVEVSCTSVAAGGNVPPSISLIAKASVPASDTDGDVIMTTIAGGIATSGTIVPVNDRLPYRVKIAAGKGLYMVAPAVATSFLACKKTVLTTIL